MLASPFFTTTNVGACLIPNCSTNSGASSASIFSYAMFSFTLIFQLITLPVEFNASSRALQILDESGMLYDDELKGAKKVLSAAAMTYVAAAIATLLSLLRLIILFGGRRRND